jgi:hypothetical protein
VLFDSSDGTRLLFFLLKKSKNVVMFLSKKTPFPYPMQRIFLYTWLFFLFFLNKNEAAWAATAHPMVADTGLYQQTFCSSQLILINGHLYDPNNPTGIEVIPGGAAGGMDSVFRVELFFNAPVEVDYVATLCDADTIFINGNAYHATHYDDVEVFENGAANGCDSIVHVLLDFRPQPFRYIRDTLCADAAYVINGTRYDVNNSFGIEYVATPTSATCDSILYIALQFRQSFAYIGPDREVIAGDTVCLSLLSNTPPQSVAWSVPVTCIGPDCVVVCTDILTQNLTVRVDFVDTLGCVVSDEVQIRVSQAHQVFAPNVLRVGSREPFDRFFLGADPGVIAVRRMVIFDRWGNHVFEQKDMSLDRSAAYDLAWDGTARGQICEMGVYGWWAELETFDGKRFERSGDVTLLR